MLQITKKLLAEQIGCDKQTVANAVNALQKRDGNLKEHITRLGQTDYLDDYAASAVSDYLSKRFPKPQSEPDTDLYKTLWDEAKRDHAAIAKDYQKQLTQQREFIENLQAQLHAERERVERATVERDGANAELARARETLAKISTAGFFTNKKAIAAQYLALPAPQSN